MSAITPQTFTQKVLFQGTEAAIVAAEKVDTGLYFATDTKKLYKGSSMIDFTDAARIVTSYPGTLVKNVLYVKADASGNPLEGKVFDGTSTVTFVLASATSISDASTDAELATAKAVYDYVQGIVGGDDVVTDVSSGTTAGAIQVTNGSTSVKSVNLPGVALKPTWNSTSRVLNIPYTANGEDLAGNVEVNIGKDMVVTSGIYDAATETIKMWISTQDPQVDEPAIVIPVSGLIDMITGGTTDTAITTYNSTANQLTADVRVSALSDNALQVVNNDATAANNGLYISLAAYATTAVTDELATSVTNVNTSVTNLESALTTWTTLTV